MSGLNASTDNADELREPKMEIFAGESGRGQTAMVQRWMEWKNMVASLSSNALEVYLDDCLDILAWAFVIV